MDKLSRIAGKGNFVEAGDVPITIHGFISTWDRDQHFEDHQAEFGGRFTTPQEYEAGAIAFFHTPVIHGMMEGLRLTDGSIIRFNASTDEFAICDKDGYIRTYFKPNPAIHGMADNISYFRRRCIG